MYSHRLFLDYHGAIFCALVGWVKKLCYCQIWSLNRSCVYLFKTWVLLMGLEMWKCIPVQIHNFHECLALLRQSLNCRKVQRNLNVMFVVQEIICTVRLHRFSICLKVVQERNSYYFVPKIFVFWQHLSGCIADVLCITWVQLNAAHM